VCEDTQSPGTDFILAIILVAGVRTQLSKMNSFRYLFKIKKT
jgi:hypothetical protein